MALSSLSFVSVDDLRTYVQAGGSGQDENFEKALNAGLTVILDVTARDWVSRGSQTEYHSVRGRRETLRLSQWPVKTVASVHESMDWPRVYDATTLLVEGTDYLVDNSLGEIRRISSGWRTCWAQGERAIKIVRTAGFSSTAEVVGAYTVAESLVEIARLASIQLSMAAGIFKQGDTKGWGDTDNTDTQGSVRRALSFLSGEDRDYLRSVARTEFGDRTWEIAA